jgi:hypothetical protein
MSHYEVYKVAVEFNDDYQYREGSVTKPWDDHGNYPPGTKRETWFQLGRGIHRDHGPAVTITLPSGVVAYEGWYKDGWLSRVVSRDEDGKLFGEIDRGPRPPGTRHEIPRR